MLHAMITRYNDTNEHESGELAWSTLGKECKAINTWKTRLKDTQRKMLEEERRPANNAQRN